jgi:hypothetical protein
VRDEPRGGRRAVTTYGPAIAGERAKRARRDEMTLDLGSQTSVTIKVKNENSTLQFSQDSGKSWQEKPITWEPVNTTDTLTITWVFDTGVTGVTVDSGNITVDSSTQWTVNQSGSTSKQDDSFTVQKSNGESEDPKIIITPQ